MKDFKVRCIESASSDFTLGKIYNIVDGVLKTNSGKIDCNCSSTEKINVAYVSQFELVTDKPRTVELCGVEVGEEFTIVDENNSPILFNPYHFEPNGILASNDGISSGNHLAALINGVEKIVRAPQFSEDENSFFRLYINSGFPIINRLSDNQLRMESKDGAHAVCIPQTLFPQITFENSPFDAKSYLE